MGPFYSETVNTGSLTVCYQLYGKVDGWFLPYQMDSYVTRQAVNQGVGDNPGADQLQSDHVNPAL